MSRLLCLAMNVKTSLPCTEYQYIFALQWIQGFFALQWMSRLLCLALNGKTSLPCNECQDFFALHWMSRLLFLALNVKTSLPCTECQGFFSLHWMSRLLCLALNVKASLPCTEFSKLVIFIRNCGKCLMFIFVILYYFRYWKPNNRRMDFQSVSCSPWTQRWPGTYLMDTQSCWRSYMWI